jgi:hypothetical protein
MLQEWVANEYHLLRGNANDIAKCARAVGVLLLGLAAAVVYMVVMLAAGLAYVVVLIAEVATAAAPPPPPPPPPPRPQGEWVFQDDSSDSGWKYFGNNANHMIEQAFQQLSNLSAQGQTHTPQGPTATLDFEVNIGENRTASYVLDFGTMKQTNKATGFKRAVRRLLAMGAHDPANVWSLDSTPVVCA